VALSSTNLDRGLGALAASIRLLAALTPSNAAEERERLVRELERGERAMPRWTYGPPDPALDEVGGWLRDVGREVKRCLPVALAELYEARVEELDLEARIARSAGHRSLAGLALSRFGVGGGVAAARAHRWASQKAPRAARSFVLSDDPDPRSLLSRMRARVRQLGLDFDVVVHPALASLAATGERTIYVASRRPVTDAVTERTVLHETLAHALPRTRARSSSLGIFRIGTARGQDDQEGLALWIEHRAGSLTAARKKELGARHVAVHAMRSGADFAQVATSLREAGLGASTAVSVAERAFRGSDGRTPGLGREAVYLSAYGRVRRLLEREPDMLTVLANGQVSTSAATLLASWVLTAPADTRLSPVLRRPARWMRT
jgi:hypothetical protein